MKFEVFAGNPYTGTTLYEMFGSYDWLESENLIYPVDDEVAKDIERAFNEAAVWYQQRGFPPPLLEPIVDTDDGPAYRVYVCSYKWEQQLWDRITEATGTTRTSLVTADQIEWSRCGGNEENDDLNAGAYVSDCNVGSRKRVIYINRDVAIGADNRLTELGYQTLAHELLHAIIPNTVFGKSELYCGAYSWITEGIADALGWDIAEELWAHRYRPSTQDSDLVKSWGYRPYFEPLPQNGKLSIPGLPAKVKLNAGYASSSFWRFVADAYPKGWNIMVAAGRRGPPGLLDLPLSGPGWRAEVDWLDQGLRARFNYGLDAIYGSFAGHFVHSVPPYARYKGKGAESQAVMDHWTNLLYEQCASVDLSSGRPQKVSLDIAELGARCLWVEPTGKAGAVQVTFQAAHDDLGLLQDVWISRPGTTLLVRASSTGELPNGSPRYISSWKDFPQEGSERTLYVISNVARKPSESKPRKIELTVSLPNNQNSARPPMPPRKYATAPGKPAFNKHAKTLGRRQSETRKMINQQMNYDKKSLSDEVSTATEVSRHPDKPDCAEPFKYQACGPTTSILLTIMPGTYSAPGQVNAQGGMASQVMGGLQAMAQTSAFDSMEVMTELNARIKTINGSTVNIATPLFDYGFSGTFDNAQISVMMRDEKRLSAIGPPDANGRTRLTGRVTITEYTPFTLRGSFVAPLAEFVESPSGPARYRRRETVTGTFTSVAPWQADERVKVVVESREVLKEDIMSGLGVPAGMGWSLEQGGNTAAQDAAGAAAGGGGQGQVLETAECTCACDTKPFVDDLCALLCEDEFAACEAP
ncbi:hypothetical protein DWB85_17310 [Seongchinamella sediminis]|uniref:Uncharacterized protein n=2 Tax=Seongchinamella sediminis TaxID=2283635 RepID=A0A3L7DSL3_9GAMM|nr:hypothetical protein DWB85_17310 [Seongchinamella sediminis]